MFYVYIAHRVITYLFIINNSSIMHLAVSQAADNVTMCE